ncbi:MAG: hypothetical protein AAFS11_09700, partial [Planctomycetota bacterium]
RDAPQTDKRTEHTTDQQQQPLAPLAPAAAAVADLLKSTELISHPNATPERLAYIAEVAPTKTNPAGWAAAAIRKGFTPAPTPSEEVEAEARRKRVAAKKAAFSRAQTMSQADRNTLWAVVRDRYPNLTGRNPALRTGIIGATGEVMLEWEADGTVTRDTPPRIVR